MSLSSRWLSLLLLSVSLGSLISCGSDSTSSPPALRLVEDFSKASLENTPTSVPEIESPQWGGEGNQELSDWKAGLGLSNFRFEEGHLRASTNGKLALIHVAKPAAINESIHSLEIRMRASGGTRVAADFSTSEEIDFDELLEESEAVEPEWKATLLPGDEFQTYVLVKTPGPELSVERIRHLLVSPTDEEGAEIEIASIRVIYRREHLSRTPTGVGWQGLGNVYRESLVSRSPEKMLYEVELPERPWLDLAIGSLDGGPLTFLVTVDDGSRSETILQKTVTTPHRWEDVPLDLEGFAGRKVTLGLELAAPEDGRLGIWGAPVIRNRGQKPIQTAPELPVGESPRGVILIVGDTLRRDHLKSYGYEKETAPHLTALMEEGVQFQDNQSQGAWTKVSVPSILTSLYPTSHGIVNIPDRLSAAAVTAAEVYRTAGYATWASSSVPFSGQLTNLHQGVEVLYERPSVPEPGAKTARPFVDYLLPWLENHKDVPFFVVLHVFDPHSPFEPRPPYNRLWVNGEERTAHDDAWAKVAEHVEEDFFKSQQLANRDEVDQAGVDPDVLLQVQKGWYDGSIKGMDDEIARILEVLERTGLRDETLIAFISDHGEEFLERGHPFHGYTVYGEMTNVPLFLNWRGRIPAGRVIEETTQSIDLLPTLLELSGLEIPELFQGKSLTPLFLEGADPERAQALRGRAAFSERRTPSWARSEWQKRESFAVVHDGWKLVHNTTELEGVPEWELFDHREDRWNLKDVAADHPEVVERMRPLLDQYLEMATAARLEPDAATEDLSEEELQHLRALGYVQ